MLAEEVKAFHEGYDSLRYTYAAIETLIPAKKQIDKTCKELKVIIDGNYLASINAEIKTAIESAYRILETAGSGLNDESVAALFGDYDGARK